VNQPFLITRHGAFRAGTNTARRESEVPPVDTGAMPIDGTVHENSDVQNF